MLHSAPVAESQSLTVLSCDADAICFPSGENATAPTQSEWPLRILHSFGVVGFDLDAITLLGAGVAISAEVPLNVRCIFKSFGVATFDLDAIILLGVGVVLSSSTPIDLYVPSAEFWS